MKRSHFLIFLSFQFLLSSCGLFDSKNKESIIIAPELSKVCSQSIGKGRFHLDSDKYVFDFETVAKSNSWLMAMQFSFHGEEVLELDWRKRGHYRGNFYHRVMGAFRSFSKKNKKYKIKDFKQFLDAMSYHIKTFSNKKLLEKLKKHCAAKHTCHLKISKHKFELSANADELVATLHIASGLTLKIRNFDPAKSFYRRTSYMLQEIGHRRKKYIFKLDLFHNQCF
jgi:hypothetical protein